MDIKDYNSGMQPSKFLSTKMIGATQYFYETLFKEGKSSDIAVRALGKVWNLHKLILSQSPYFNSMLSGSWKESRAEVIQIEILDDCITINALDAVFGAMYSDQIEIDSNDISVLATAALFNLDLLIGKCEEALIDSINEETVVQLHEAACRYGSLNLKEATFAWLENNIYFYPDDTRLLREISVDLMTKLVTSSDLQVCCEFNLYEQLRYWMYLLLHPECDKKDPAKVKQLSWSGSKNEEEFFANHSDKRPFLSLPEGQQFLPTFQALRTQHLVNYCTRLKVILRDNIIPKQWLNSHVMDTWQFLLLKDSKPEKSDDIEVPENLDPEVFLKHCLRFGYIFERSYMYIEFREFDAFNFGFNCEVYIDSSTLSIKRCNETKSERVVCLREKWPFMIRMSITSVNSQRKQKSQIFYLKLGINEESTLMHFDSNLKFPAFVSVNILLVPPTELAFKQIVLSNEEMANDAVPPFDIEVHRNTAVQQENTPINSKERCRRNSC